MSVGSIKQHIYSLKVNKNYLNIPFFSSFVNEKCNWCYVIILHDICNYMSKSSLLRCKGVNVLRTLSSSVGCNMSKLLDGI